MFIFQFFILTVSNVFLNSGVIFFNSTVFARRFPGGNMRNSAIYRNSVSRNYLFFFGTINAHRIRTHRCILSAGDIFCVILSGVATNSNH